MVSQSVLKTIITFCAVLTLCFTAAAEEASEKKGPEAGEPASFTSSDRVTINGKSVSYDVTAKETFLLDDKDQPAASIFSFSYVRQGETNPENRPVMFVFNGGPGSASLWLHMGVIGPKLVDVATDKPDDDGAPPYPIVSNPYSMLDEADLVFIDPVGTGYSRLLEDGEGKDHWGVKQDAHSVGRFIRRWLTENKRWGSPKYLAGESYGTTRAAALVAELNDQYNDVALNGVILISAILDFELDSGNYGYLSSVPTQAAIGWYHNKVDRSAWNNDFDAFLADARDFAAREFATALILGQTMDDAEMATVISRYASLTGLSEQYLKRARIRVDVGRFMKELLRDQGLTVGRYDGRYTGRDADDVGEYTYYDPSGYAMDSAFTGAMNDYMTRILNIEMNRDYEVLSYAVNEGWQSKTGGGSGGPGYTNVVEGLARGMRENKDLRVLLAAGYYDQATPMFGAELSLAEPGVPMDRVETTYYPAGHMMYLDKGSLKKLSDDLHAFVK